MLFPVSVLCQYGRWCSRLNFSTHTDAVAAPPEAAEAALPPPCRASSGVVQVLLPVCLCTQYGRLCCSLYFSTHDKVADRCALAARGAATPLDVGRVHTLSRVVALT